MFSVMIPKVVTKPTKLVGKKSGNFLQEQLCTINHPDLFTPVAATVLLEEGQEPYKAGRYEIAAESITAGEYGRPQFRLKIGKALQA